VYDPRPTDRLTTTQCALLPLCGVPAHRAVRTIPHSAVKTGPDGKRRAMRVLVLQAHDGAGLLAVQMMRGLGMRVTAQVPVGSEAVGFGLELSLGPRDRGRTRAGKAREDQPVTSKRMEPVEVVVGDDPIEVIGRLEEGVYDAVIDTVGGRRVWDACRGVMCSDAHVSRLLLSACGRGIHSLCCSLRPWLATRRTLCRRSMRTFGPRSGRSPGRLRNETRRSGTSGCRLRQTWTTKAKTCDTRSTPLQTLPSSLPMDLRTGLASPQKIWPKSARECSHA
jgi:hypothetical protein